MKTEFTTTTVLNQVQHHEDVSIVQLSMP